MKPAEQLDRWTRIRGHLCWSSVALAPALAALTFERAHTRVTTARCTDRGTVYVNLEWSAQQPSSEIAFAILHFVLHVVLKHHSRRDGRQHELWGMAADLVINDAIHEMWSEVRGRDHDATPVQRPVAALWRDRDAAWIPAGQSVEAVYTQLGAKGSDGGAGNNGTDGADAGDATSRANPPPGAGCDVEDGLPESADALSEGEWSDMCEAIGRGVGAGATGMSALRALFEPVVCTVRWETLLRGAMANAAATAAHDTVSWSRRNRRSPPYAILPGGVSITRQIAVVIDSSGSMSDRDLSACIAETRGAVVASRTAAFLVVHDHQVQTATWITPQDPMVEIAKLVVGRGGTNFAPAYEAVAAVRHKRFSSFIHFTDGMPCDPWPTRPANCQDGIAAITLNGHEPPGGWRMVRVAIR